MRSATFCVAVDGSHVSYQAMRLAMSLMQRKDTLLVLHAVEEGSLAGKDANAMDADTLHKNAVIEALKYRLLAEQVQAESIELKPDRSVAQFLVSTANTRGKVFVVGASGRGAEQSKSSASHPLGSVAEQCLYHSKCPIILARDTLGKFAFKHPEDIDQSKPRPALNLAVAVDGSNIAKRAFDRAVSFVSPGDSIAAYHVHDGMHLSTNPAFLLKNVKSLYEAECAKASALRHLKGGTFEAMARRGGDTIASIMSAKCADEHVDLLLLGSIVLADPTKGMYLGSVAAGCAKQATTSVCIIKNYA
mmetsp:Transcript_14820/g.39894  ORF Transcript_14820/g.39894 Transcript_14820/m.39894 type:complete len:304 (-) Transcript_14820:89-1000(-)